MTIQIHRSTGSTPPGSLDPGQLAYTEGNQTLHIGLIGGGIDSIPLGSSAPASIPLATSENLAIGDLVNIYNNAGTATARKADAIAGYPAHGFVLAATTSPASADVYVSGIVTGLSGMTPADRQYLAATGGVSDTPATVTDEVVQFVGIAITSSTLAYFYAEPITLT
jgi:hypothetical protein